MLPGLQIAPSIRITRRLGEGGMGSVWLADHLALKTSVVVKFMSDALARDALSRERFSREAVAASQVKSPHVVQTFDHGVTPDGVPFIVMELLEGEDLSHSIQRGPLATRHVASILTQVCRALSRAHAIGVIHRDIKPDNIFLCDVGADEPFVKLLDFGIAKNASNPTLDSKTRTGAMIGTPYYMSPEQFAGTRDVDFRTDLWALGVVAYECVTGGRPFDAATIGGLAIAVHSGELPIPSQIRPELPPALDAWFRRACARPVLERFQSATELAQSFLAAISAGGEPALPSDRALVSHPNPFASTESLPQSGAGAAQEPRVFVSTGGAASFASRTAPPPIKSKLPMLAFAVVALILVGIGAFGLSRPSTPSATVTSAPVPSVSSAPTPSATSVPDASGVQAASAAPTASAAPAAAPVAPSAKAAPTVKHATPAATPSAPSDPFGSHIF